MFLREVDPSDIEGGFFEERSSLPGRLGDVISAFHNFVLDDS